MTLDEYQWTAQKTRLPMSDRMAQVLGLCAEAGEVADLFQKDIEGKLNLSVHELKNELGDVLWRLSAVAADHGLTLEEVAQANLDKLAARHADLLKASSK